MAFGNPSQAQIDATVPVKQGNVLVDRGNDDYIFASGIMDPEHSNFLSYQYPQYLATAMLERIGRYEAIEQDVWSWSEMDRTRSGATVTSGSPTGGETTVTLVTDIDNQATGSDGYFLVNDQLITESGVTLIVTAVGVSTTFQTITVKKADGTTFLITDVADLEGLGHLAQAFGEYSDAPKGRLYLPNERYNQLQTLRRSCHISGKALTNRTYLNGGKSWAYEQEMIDMDEFARDRENAVVFSDLSPDNAAEPTCEGIISAVTRGGVQTFYAGAVTENDIQDHVKQLKISSPAKEYIAFAGAEFMSDAHKALKDYHIAGAVDYGVFSNINTVGLTLNAYKFMDTTVYFVHYPVFDDLETLPYSGTATANKPNYSNYSLWLNLGTQRGKKLLSLKYKSLDGKQRKFIYKHEDGIMGDGAKVANGLDGMSTHMLSEVAPEVRSLNQHGILRANG
jgi:hypothetical protein